MNFYDDLVMQTQRNYSKYYPIYASGSTPYPLTDKKPLPYSEQIQRLVQEVKDAGVDTLILGCTHYPLLKKMIGDFMGSDVTLIDSGKVTAQAAAAALADLGLLNGRTKGGNAHYYVSDTPDNFDELEHRFLGEYAGGPVEQIAIETY